MDRNIERMRARLRRARRVVPPARQDQQVDRRHAPDPADRAGPITVSTLLEADYFAGHGFKDILYAVCIAPNKLAHVAALQAQGVRLSLILDSMEAARMLAAERQARRAVASTC